MQDLNRECQPPKPLELEHDVTIDHDELADALECDNEVSEKEVSEKDNQIKDEVVDSFIEL